MKIDDTGLNRFLGLLNTIPVGGEDSRLPHPEVWNLIVSMSVPHLIKTHREYLMTLICNRAQKELEDTNREVPDPHFWSVQLSKKISEIMSSVGVEISSDFVIRTRSR